jgi:CRP-like cAMP-binding protein
VRHELSVHALTEVRAQYLARAVCERLVQEPSLLSSRLLMALARQVKLLRMHSPLVAAGSGVRGRLAALLLQLGERFGQKLNAGGLRIELQLSCELLGQMLDSHRSTVNMELIELRQRGLIERTEGRIVILDEAGLEELAESVF